MVHLVECFTCKIRKVCDSEEETHSFLVEHKGHDRVVQEVARELKEIELKELGFLPMEPDKGPPLPRMLKLKWPWKK